MEFKIPFTRGSPETLGKTSFSALVPRKRTSKLHELLATSGVSITREEYIGISLRTASRVGITLAIIASTLFFFLGVGPFIPLGVGIGVLAAGFVFMAQQIYPKLYVSRKQREIERNLLPALEDMLVQLNAGVPLFSIMVNISSSDYGELSNEFKKTVKKMNAGVSQADALDDLGKNNPSPYFRRTLWQISNGMKAGSDSAVVIKESIKSLNQEQIVQIQAYGNKLNPLIMFYMLISVILPSLAVTFLTIISSMVNLEATVAKMLFIGLFVCVTVVQIMFLGIIKSTRPSLL